MGPRAAWRLESLGFTHVYDYVGSKMDWLGAGLPFEGTLADEPRLGTLADPDVPTCRLDDSAADARARLGDWELCVVVNDQQVVLGVVPAEALAGDDDRRLVELMRASPKTFRPHVTAEELASELDESPRPWVLVTNLDGTLVGVARPDDIRRASGGES